MTPTATSTLNFKNIQSGLKSRATPDAAAPDLASSVALGDWDAHSIAVVAQATAPLHLRSTDGQAQLD